MKSYEILQDFNHPLGVWDKGDLITEDDIHRYVNVDPENCPTWFKRIQEKEFTEDQMKKFASDFYNKGLRKGIDNYFDEWVCRYITL